MDSSSPKSQASKVKHHKKGSKGKAKVALNPQPLPPAKIPVDQGGSSGVPPGTSNAHQ
jgi:hypothetical protein